jgi:hypothetical protein
MILPVNCSLNLRDHFVIIAHQSNSCGVRQVKHEFPKSNAFKPFHTHCFSLSNTPLKCSHPKERREPTNPQQSPTTKVETQVAKKEVWPITTKAETTEQMLRQILVCNLNFVIQFCFQPLHPPRPPNQLWRLRSQL